MRIWADVLNTTDTLIGTVYSVISPTITKALDEIGSLSFSTPATDETALSLLTNEARVRVYVEHDDVSRELGRGVIRKVTATANAGGYTLNFDCVGSMDALNRKNVLLGRSYTNQPIATIATDLTALVSGWSVGVDAGVGNQTSRYDGVSVFKALLRTATEKGLHVREGTAANTIEIGAFGDDSGLFAVSPSHSSVEILGNDDIVLIESIVQETDSRDVVNWVVPLGAGEGSAALTLKNATATSYPINTMTAPDGSTLYYLTDTNSVLEYGQIEKIVTFKEIAPVTNSATAKAYAANSLYDAAVAWLDRNKDPLVTYRLTVRKPRVNLRPGQKITVSYKGFVATDGNGGELVPISVENQPFWLMKITERITDSGDVLELTVSSIDRYQQDMNKIVVDAIESMQARNVAVGTYPLVIPFMAYDTLKEGTTFGSGYSQGKKAKLDVRINDYITDIQRVELRFVTYPLYRTSHLYFLSSPNFYSKFDLLTSSQYPSGISVFINGDDVTTALTDLDTSEVGPFNTGSNTQTDNRVDISDYIINATGGIYQNHTIELHCEARLGGDVSFGSPDPAVTNQPCSQGQVFILVYVFGSVRAN